MNAKVDLEKIKLCMFLNKHTNRFMANYLELSETGWHNKKNGLYPLNAIEIKKIADLYRVPVDELYKKSNVG